MTGIFLLTCLAFAILGIVLSICDFGLRTWQFWTILLVTEVIYMLGSIK